MMRATAPTTTTSTTAPKPHQPSRLRQNWPARAVNSANVAYAPMRERRRPVVMRSRLSRGALRAGDPDAAAIASRGIRASMCSDERGLAGDLAADDEGVHLARALVGVQRL